ncbi:MAG: PhoH family protein, partial [Phycisphaerales bacterium]|nr:PhoH family protein [Phycisphaerales bacterium]
DVAQKLNPYMRPIYDALHDQLEAEEVMRLEETGVIEVAPLAYMRGRTLNHAVVILDEAQNTTPSQMLMFLTRLGNDSKMIVTGDDSQMDLGPGQPSGLVDAARKLADCPGLAILRLSGADIVRHPLVQNIVSSYQRFEDLAKERQRTNRAPNAPSEPEPSADIES